MALDFLSGIGNGLSSIASIATPIMNILGAIKGPQKVQQLPIPEGERFAASLYKAIADPNNSLVRSMTDSNIHTGMNALGMQLMEQQLADRREASMGRNPTFFDPERADQTIAYLTSRGAPAIAENAHVDAINQLLHAASGAGGFAGAQTGRYQNYMAAQGASKEAQLQNPSSTMMGRINTGIGSIDQILGALSKFGQSAPTNTWQPNNSAYSTYGNPNVMRYNA